MSPKYIMGMGFIFMAGTLISLTFGGGWLGDTEANTLNSIAAFRSANVLGLWSIMVPNLDFLTAGIGALVQMDFAFFGGTMDLLRWFFICTISAGIMFGLFCVMIVTASNLWRR